eukprot:GEMP01005153.1.p1 GENE.GEMP01005153.1~~GEMP01005153.1.p1  ORF type:complete len:1040 (+),score=193.35 GEMP01005153.1:192-3311(+)
MLSPTSSYASSQASSRLHQTSRHSLLRRGDGVRRSPLLRKRHPEPTDEEIIECGALKQFSAAAFRRLVNAVKKSTTNDAPTCAAGPGNDAALATVSTTACALPPTPKLHHSNSDVISEETSPVPSTPSFQAIPDENPQKHSVSDKKQIMRGGLKTPKRAVAAVTTQDASAEFSMISIAHPCAAEIRPSKLTTEAFQVARAVKAKRAAKTATSLSVCSSKTTLSRVADERTSNASSERREQSGSVLPHVKHHGFAVVVTTAIVADSESTVTSVDPQSAREKVDKSDQSAISRRIKRQKEAQRKHTKRIATAVERESGATKRALDAIRLAEILRRNSRKQTRAGVKKIRGALDEARQSERSGVGSASDDSEHMGDAVVAQQKTAQNSLECATAAREITAHCRARGGIRQLDSVLPARAGATVTRPDDAQTLSGLRLQGTMMTSLHNSIPQQPATCDLRFLGAATTASAGGFLMDRSPDHAVPRSRILMRNQRAPPALIGRSCLPPNVMRCMAQSSGSKFEINADDADPDDDISTMEACVHPCATSGRIHGIHSKEVGQGNEGLQRHSDDSDPATEAKECCNDGIPRLELASGSASVLFPGVIRAEERASIDQSCDHQSEYAPENKRATVLPVASESIALYIPLSIVDTSANLMNYNQSLTPASRDGDRTIAAIARDVIHMSDKSAAFSTSQPHYAIRTVSSNRKLDCVRTPRVIVLRNSDGTPKAANEVFRASWNMGGGFPLSLSFELASSQPSVSSLDSHPCTPRSRIPSPRSDPTPSSPSNTTRSRFLPPTRIPAKRSAWWSAHLPCDSPRTKSLKPPLPLRSRSLPTSPRLSPPSWAMSRPPLRARSLTPSRFHRPISSRSRDSSCGRDSATSTHAIQRSHSLPPIPPLALPLRSSGRISSISLTSFVRSYPTESTERWQVRLPEVSRISLPCFSSARPAPLRTLPMLSRRLQGHAPSTPGPRGGSALPSKVTLFRPTPRSRSASPRRPLRTFSLFSVTLPSTLRLFTDHRNLHLANAHSNALPPRDCYQGGRWMSAR